MKALSLSVLFFVLGLQTSFAQDPEETPQIVGDRTASTPQTVSGTLTKNIYKYVTREEHYIEKVPYTELVPYQSWETTKKWEWTLCIEDGKEVWRWKEVTRTEWVTRYREELRYRDVPRTRTVTDKVFSKQWGLSVSVEFPKDSQPLTNETEKVSMKLVGNENAPDVELEVKSLVFAYQIAEKKNANGSIYIRLEHSPLYAPQSLGGSTISDFQLAEKVPAPGMEIRFTDRGVVPRSTNRREVVISDAKTGKELARGNATLVSGYTNRYALSLPSGFNLVDDYILRLNMERTSEAIQGGVAKFSAQTTQLGLIDARDFTDSSKVEIVEINGVGSQAKLVIKDLSPVHADVKTEFTVMLYKGSQRFFFASDIGRKDYDVGGGMIEIPVGQLRNWDGQDTPKFFYRSAKIGVELSTYRSSQRLGKNSPVSMKHQQVLYVK